MTDVYPLTPMQQLFFSMDGGEASPGFEQWEFLIEGPTRCRRGCGRHGSRWPRRHPILRTAFVQAGGAKPHQVVLEHVDVPWHVEDWRDRTQEQQDQLAPRLPRRRSPAAFDLDGAAADAVALLRDGRPEHRLIWSTHHLLVDGWSWPLIFSELSALYAPAPGAARDLGPACAYREYVAWLQQHDGAADEAFWRGVLSGVVESDADSRGSREPGRHVAEAEGAVVRLLSVQTTAALGALARSHQVTLGAIVGAAWSVVLAHHSGRSDVVFGASFAGRPDGIPGIETMVGPCVNNLPIRVHVDEPARASGSGCGTCTR